MDKERIHLTVFKFGLFLFLVVLGLCCCVGFSLVAANGGYSLVVMCGLLIVVASLVVEHGLQGMQASVDVLPGSRAQAQ